MAWSWTVIVAGLCLGQAHSNDAITPEAISAAISQLGADRFEAREQATEFLWGAGELGHAALVKATQSTDREVVRRAKVLLEKLELGIRPDTSLEVAAMLRSYRAGDETVRQGILDSLNSSKSFEMIVRLLRSERSERLRSQQVDKLLRNREAVSALFTAGNYDDLDRIMPLLALSPDRHQLYTAYVALAGKLDSQAADLQASTNDVEQLLLARLLRMQGKPDEALQRLQQIPFEDRDVNSNARRRSLEAELLQTTGQWGAVAQIFDTALLKGVASDGGIESLGQSAFFHRLAGNRERFEIRIAELKDHARKNPSEVWYCLEALLVNDRFADAVQVARDDGPARGGELLEKQLRYREALELNGWNGSTSAAAWYARALEQQSPDKKDPHRIERQASELATLLARVGNRDDAQALFQLAAEKCHDNLPLLSSIIKAQRQAQLSAWRDQAVQALQRITKESSDPFGGSITSVVGDSSGAWWKFFREEYPADTLLQSLERLEGLVDRRFGSSKLSDDQRSLVDRAIVAAQSLEGELKRRRLAEIGDFCQKRGETQLAQRCYREFVTLLPTQQGWLKLGDLAASESQWDAAAEAYDSSYQLAKDPLPLFLRGAMLAKLGRQEEADQAQRLARFLPIVDSTHRATLAGGLNDRNLGDAALAEWRFVARSSDIAEWGMGNALQHIGNSLSKEQPLEAATCWERLRFTTLRTSSGFINVDNYFQLSSTIHRVRTRGLLDQGEAEKAFAAAQLSIDAKPGDVDNAIALTQFFQNANQPDHAASLFTRIERTYLQLIEDFPDSAPFHNSLAWLLVKTDRDLDRALKHARRAVAITPNDPPPLDTLALVLHKRGEHREAVELARRCAALEPGDSHFQKQLDEFAKAAR